MNLRAGWTFALAASAAALLCSCSGGTGGGKYFQNDGPPLGMADAGNIPDAVPRAEPIHRASTKPYVVMGKRYTPIGNDVPLVQTGIASWYGKQFHGNKTSCGERYDMYSMSAAHTVMPLPSYAIVTNLENGRRVIVRVNDRGPFLHNRVMDLSYAAACKLGYARKGTARVRIERIPASAIRNGTWQIAGAAPAKAAPAPARPAEVAEPEPEGTPVPVPVRVEQPEEEAMPQWASQIGSFSSRENALALVTHAQAVIGDGSIPVKIVSRAGRWCVIAGGAQTREEARAQASQISSRLGRQAFAVQVSSQQKE